MSNAILECPTKNVVTEVSPELRQYQLLTIRHFCKVFPWPSESAMRAYVYRAQELGISDAFVRVGRRVLVAPYHFFSLIKKIENQSTKGDCYEKASWREGKKDL